MRIRYSLLILLSLSLCGFIRPPLTETIVILRHAEKPVGGLGQLTCQGLNRALALPQVINTKFGHPDHIFAPDTHVKILDGLNTYDYVRPLATIEPTAISNGLPVNTQYGYSSDHALAEEVLKPAYRTALVVIAWEHVYASFIAQNILTLMGAGKIAPPWPDSDYDSLYVINIDWNKTPAIVTFDHLYEGLNNLSLICPTGK